MRLKYIHFLLRIRKTSLENYFLLDIMTQPIVRDKQALVNRLAENCLVIINLIDAASQSLNTRLAAYHKSKPRTTFDELRKAKHIAKLQGRYNTLLKYIDVTTGLPLMIESISNYQNILSIIDQILADVLTHCRQTAWKDAFKLLRRLNAQLAHYYWYNHRHDPTSEEELSCRLSSLLIDAPEFCKTSIILSYSNPIAIPAPKSSSLFY